MFDCAIIGTGPAGISAALTLKARGKSFVLFGNSLISNKVAQAELINNYPGITRISGSELKLMYIKQLESEDIEVTPKTVTGIYQMGEYYSILCNQDMYEAKTIILATGVESVKPIPGELEFVGRGVSYCATCDGFLYKDKKIAVVCTAKSFEHEIAFLSDIASEVILFPIYKNVGINADNITVISGMPSEVAGDMKVTGIRVKDETIPVDGVFMLKDAVSPSVLINGIEVKDGHVIVDRECKTNLPGVFAAGDMTGRPYQYAKAMGEGNIAAHSVVEILK